MMKRVPVFTSLAISSNDVLSDLCEHIVRTLTCTLVCAQEAEADLPPELVGQILRLQGAAQARRRQDCAREVPQNHRLPRQGRATGACVRDVCTSLLASVVDCTGFLSSILLFTTFSQLHSEYHILYFVIWCSLNIIQIHMPRKIKQKYTKQRSFVASTS